MELATRLGAGAFGLLLLFVTMRRAAQSLARDRLDARDESENLAAVGAARRGKLGTWLARAGLRQPDIERRFLTGVVIAAVVGALAGIGVAALGVPELLASWSGDVPGGFGDVSAPILMAMPWLVFVLVASLPWLWVRNLRQRRVDSIERDLPVMLELLATLGEAGLGLDAGLQRVLAVHDARRPLAQELRQFQQDTLAGMPRLRALRQLADQTDLASTSILVAALLQAEQVGAGLAETLRGQAHDLWSRRREDALTKAQGLPARLAFPLVICFLPALFVITLGPILVDFLELAESVIGRTQ